ncbi:MAG TPA: hypothetical protein VKQ71_09090, partial [Acidimicrobiales bacterium]|nr:hypothetical protein [Acidimicrobiales bacterium]
MVTATKFHRQPEQDAAGDSPAGSSDVVSAPTLVNPRWRRLGIVAGALFLVYVLWQVTRLGGTRHQVLIGDLANVPFYVL